MSSLPENLTLMKLFALAVLLAISALAYIVYRTKRKRRHGLEHPCPKCKNVNIARFKVRQPALGLRRCFTGVECTCGDPGCAHVFWAQPPYLMTYSWCRWWLEPWQRNITRPSKIAMPGYLATVDCMDNRGDDYDPQQAHG